MDLDKLETPCLVLDKRKTQKNISFLQGRVKTLGVNLRPHGKTAKNIDVLKMALVGQSGGITVSTLKEAEYYFSHGIKDMVYAVGIAPVKLDRIVRLIRNGANMSVILDSVEQVKFVAVKGMEYGLNIPIFIELDCDGRRAGVMPGDSLLVDIGNLACAEDGVELIGVLTHAGGSYQCRSVQEIKEIAETERSVAVESADILRQNGLPCPIVSVGSTPTANFATDFTGVTEVRAGVFVFHDLMMVGLGVCGLDDISMSVLVSVVGHQKKRGWVITDGGFLALSSDRGTAKQDVDQGYGLVCDIGGKPLRDMIVLSTNQEHGIIADRNGKEVDWKAFEIGSMVRILPNHACNTAAMFDQYNIVDTSTEIVDVWHRVNGW